MPDYQDLTIRYLAGKIAPSDYETLIEKNDALYQWIQELVPEGKQFSYCTPPSHELNYYPYDIRNVMKVHERLDYGGPKGSLGYHYYIHQEIADLVKMAFPEMSIDVDVRPQILNRLRITACPRYIGGTEVAQNNILGQVLSDISMEWTPQKQVKAAKERIKAAFHIEGNRYPHWIQEPEWPVNNGIPMKYLETIPINKEFVQHIFVDTETGEVRMIQDFF